LTTVQNNNLKKITKKSGSKSIIQTVLSEIRNNDVGDMVNVTGTVAVLPGILGSQFFYIVDDTSGVQIYMYKKDFPELKVGDEVEVIGEISELYGETRIKVKEKSDIKNLGFKAEPIFKTLEMAEIGEMVEGSLIEVSGEITEIKKSYLYLDDGTEEVQIYLKSGTNINNSNLEIGDILKVKGLVHQTKNNYQILPRFQNDIEKIGVNELIIENQKDMNSSSSIAEKYLTATSGGLTSILFGLFIRNKKTSIVAGLKKISGIGLSFIRRKVK